MDARIGQTQLPAGWMMDRHAAAKRTELRAGDLAVWPARPAEQPSKTEQLQDAAQKWVGQTFFGAMLKQMRNSPFKSEIFSGGRGGEAFAGMLDQQLAERMARGAGRSLANSIVRQIEHRGGRHTDSAESSLAVRPSGRSSQDGLKPELRTDRSFEDRLKPVLQTDGLKPELRTGRSFEDRLKPVLQTDGLKPGVRTE